MHSIQVEDVAILVDREDFEDLEPMLAYTHLKLRADGVPLIKCAGWQRWRRLDEVLVRSKCGRRNGEMLDMRRTNLIPCERGILRRYCS
jgi:hypothetical protein